MPTPTRPTTRAARWRAVAARDRRADGHFVYAVRTTGVYCRPSCAARLARRENVEFHPTPADAERAGFRACKRCRPDRPIADDPNARAVTAACERIDLGDPTPDLADLATAAGLSPSHFHRRFKAMTGLTPKAYATAGRARRVRHALSQSPDVTSAVHAAGFNSAGRFYATAAATLGMKPAAFRAGGAGATLRFAVGQCALGAILVAATPAGVCWIALGDDPDALLRDFQNGFPNAELIAADAAFDQLVARVIAFVDRPAAGLNLPLDVQGTAFQHRVWQKLRGIPCGQTRTYSQLARDLGQPDATRAVAGACAANPVALAIPCHRVVRTDGSLSGYRWGLERKAKLLKAEADRP